MFYFSLYLYLYLIIPHLPLALQRLQLSLVGFLSQRLVDFGHDGDLLAPVADRRVVLGLR